jgi:hypothetical protein
MRGRGGMGRSSRHVLGSAYLVGCEALHDTGLSVLPLRCLRSKHLDCLFLKGAHHHRRWHNWEIFIVWGAGPREDKLDFVVIGLLTDIHVRKRGKQLFYVRCRSGFADWNMYDFRGFFRNFWSFQLNENVTNIDQT